MEGEGVDEKVQENDVALRATAIKVRMCANDSMTKGATYVGSVRAVADHPCALTSAA